MGTVMNIYGKFIDDNTINGQRILMYRSMKPNFNNVELVEKRVRNI